MHTITRQTAGSCVTAAESLKEFNQEKSCFLFKEQL